jgi:putative ABC transport system permease protein
MGTFGIYGVTSYGVRLRRVEIGTRMALGATREQVLGHVVGGGLRMAALGVAIGGVVALAGAWYLGDAVAIPSLGPAPLAYSSAVVGLVASAASVVPAWLAPRLSPIVAIRNESESRGCESQVREVRAPAAAPGEALGGRGPWGMQPLK